MVWCSMKKSTQNWRSECCSFVASFILVMPGSWGLLLPQYQMC